ELKQTSRSTTGILDMVMDGVQSAIDYGNEVGTIIITVFLPNKKLRYAFNNQKYDKLNQNLEIINRNLEIQPEITVNDDTTVFGRKWIWNRI
ncbi:MAG: hypothetical protein OEY49_13385, partial [Candidatus Heimdallarchaeota archaeon]|nr:hypothetical protein [Candidatus Heimdallarchaeota archaeon]